MNPTPNTNAHTTPDGRNGRGDRAAAGTTPVCATARGRARERGRGKRERERGGARESERARGGGTNRTRATGNEQRETEETERLYGTVVATTQLLVQSWGGARTHTAPLSWGRKEGQNTS